MNSGIFGTASGLKEARRGKILGLQPIWESPDQGTLATMYTGGSFIQWNHGLGVVPKLWKCVLRNLVTDGGWTPGYEIDISSLHFNAGAAASQGTNNVQYCNSILIGFQAFDSLDAQYPLAWNSTTGSQFSITPGSWRPMARIYG